MQVLLLTYRNERSPFTDRLTDGGRACRLSGIELTLCGVSGPMSEHWRDHDLPFVELESLPHRRMIAEGPGNRLVRTRKQALFTLPLVSFVGSVAKPFDAIHAVDPMAATEAVLAARLARAASIVHLEAHATGRAERWFARRATALTATAHDAGTVAVRLDDAGRAKIRPVPLGGDNHDGGHHDGSTADARSTADVLADLYRNLEGKR